MKKNNSLMRQFGGFAAASVVCYFLLVFFCLDSLNSFCLLSLVPIVPMKTYSNSEADKDTILSDNKNKSGIYMWQNTINGKRYIGSSENLNRRLSEYFNNNYLIRENSMQICRAMLKYVYSNFSLIILEYCDKEKGIEKEKYYINLFESEYNVIKDHTIPRMSGRKH